MAALGRRAAPRRQLLALVALASLLGPGVAAARVADGAHGAGRPPAMSPAPPAALVASLPAFKHIYVIVMENREYRSIVGNAAAPYINRLIRRYGLATNYHAPTHPSLPNYLALFAGSTFGIRDDATHDLTRRNLADQLEAAGRTWRVYAQDYPGRCFRGSAATGPIDLTGRAGTYVRKHDPAISFTNISNRPARCARITRLSAFRPAAADFELIVPNLVNDMHDGTIAQGDAFLRDFVPLITGSAAFAGSLLVITWDEGTTGDRGGGHVATLVVSPRVTPGFRSGASHDHYALLRTIENAWGLPCLRKACGANDLREFFAR